MQFPSEAHPLRCVLNGPTTAPITGCGTGVSKTGQEIAYIMVAFQESELAEGTDDHRVLIHVQTPHECVCPRIGSRWSILTCERTTGDADIVNRRPIPAHSERVRQV